MLNLLAFKSLCLAAEEIHPMISSAYLLHDQLVSEEADFEMAYEYIPVDKSGVTQDNHAMKRFHLTKSFYKLKKVGKDYSINHIDDYGDGLSEIGTYAFIDGSFYSIRDIVNFMEIGSDIKEFEDDLLSYTLDCPINMLPRYAKFFKEDVVEIDLENSKVTLQSSRHEMVAKSTYAFEGNLLGGQGGLVVPELTKITSEFIIDKDGKKVRAFDPRGTHVIRVTHFELLDEDKDSIELPISRVETIKDYDSGKHKCIDRQTGCAK